jgi:hypothetical protein
MPSRSFRGLGLFVLALLTACGGSGDGGGGGDVVPPIGVIDDSVFQGDYFTALTAGGHGLGAEGRGGTGVMVADGAGVVVHSQTINDSGVVFGPGTSPYGFDVAADGSLELSIAATVFARGGISADGRCALLGTVAPGLSPGFLVLHRREGQFANASLSGDYRLVSFQFAPVTGASLAFTGLVTFDGGGVMTGSATLNSMGALLVGPLPASAYSVVADGTSVLTLGAADVEGGVLSGGAVAVWAGSTTATENPAIHVAVKAGATAGLSTLQGEYWAVAIRRDPVTDDFTSLTGTVTSDGVGGVTLLATANTEGVITVDPPQPTTYLLSATGQLTIDPAGSVLVGGVTQDGSFAAVAGGTSPGSDPILLILCRK